MSELQSFLRYPNGKLRLVDGAPILCDCCDRIATRFERPEKGIRSYGGAMLRVRPRKKYCDDHYTAERTMKNLNQRKGPSME